MSDKTYLELVRNVLENGTLSTNRTNVDTLSLVGTQSRYSLENNTIPLLTTKHMYWKGILVELCWFLSGSTDLEYLHKHGVHFWDANAHGSSDLGPIYGHQWRNYGGKYISNRRLENAQDGVDQIRRILYQLQHMPDSRRIILTAWNPTEINEMALPPCHAFAQFLVKQGKLTCLLYQRSGDVGLGVPFNIASYGLLTILLAHLAGLKPGELVHTIGDAHIYLTHKNALERQLGITPKDNVPYVTFTNEVSDRLDPQHVELHNYTPGPKLKMKMVV